MPRPRVAYLLGTGATNAEKHLELKIRGTGINEKGELEKPLTNTGVSNRVIDKLLDEHSDLLKTYGIEATNIETTWEKRKNADIEFLISMLSQLTTEDAHAHKEILREYYREDIIRNSIINTEIIKPQILTALIELHNIEGCDEELLGFSTLNYDSLLEEAFAKSGQSFNYGIENIELDTSITYPYNHDSSYLLLKLHGSFDWYESESGRTKVASTGDSRTMMWVPPELNKNYSDTIFEIIQQKFQNMLGECDILRVIGSSLSYNDLTLISLLFKTQQQRRPNTYTIEYIGRERTYRRMVGDKLGTLLTFEELFYDDEWWSEHEKRPTKNAFLDWLFFKKSNTEIRNINTTEYLNKIDEWYERYENP